MAKEKGGRKPVPEILFWAVLLAADVLLAVWIYRTAVHSNGGVMTVMPVMMPVVGMLPPVAAAFRYIPKEKKGKRALGLLAAVILGIGLGEVLAFGLWGDPPFLADAIYGKSIESCLPGNLKEIAAVLQENGEPAGPEYSLSERLEYYQQYTDGFFNPLDYRPVRGEAPEAPESVLLRLVDSEGRERRLRLYEADSWDYMEEPGTGIWRRKMTENSGISQYALWRREYIRKEFSTAFLDPFFRGEEPALSADYSGGEKAVWIQRGHVPYSSEITTSASWLSAPDSGIPEGYEAERASEVRWLFTKLENNYFLWGVVEEVPSGKKVKDVYHSSWVIRVYDLVTGESKVLGSGTPTNTNGMYIRDYMQKYFDARKQESP